MADTTEGDTNVLDLGLLAPALIALIAGLLIHSFIIGVNVSDWWRGRSVTPVDHIVTSLGISRIWTQCDITLDVLVFMLLPNNQYLDVILAVTDIFYGFFTYTNIWLTSLLSIVLCLKISNLHTRLFLYLRRMILHRTGRLIVASVVVSTLQILMTLLLSISKITRGRSYNTTGDNHLPNCMFDNSIYTFTIGSFFPHLFYYISSVLLFFSLYHHTTRMKRSSNLSINLETYYSAMKLVSFTFTYNTLYCIGHFVSVFYYYFYCAFFLWPYIVLDFLPALHSSYLIYSTTRLRNQMSKALHHALDFILQRKHTDTGENIEIEERRD